MHTESWNAKDPVTLFIVSPLMALLLMSVAILTASIVVGRAGTALRTVAEVEAARYKSIDGLRGFLGVGVFIHHVMLTWLFLHGAPWGTIPSRFVLHLGQTSVALFFMITAFLFWGRVLARGAAMDWAEFLVSRIYRLYPVYLIVLALVLVSVAVLTWGQPVASPSALAKPLLQWLLMFGTPDLNGLHSTGMLIAGVTWTLRYEWLFYLALPAIGFAAGGSRHVPAALISALIVGALLYHAAGSGLFQTGILQSFLGGIAGAYWVRYPALTRVARGKAATVAAIMALVAVVVFSPTAFALPATAGLSVFFIAVASGNDLGGTLRRPALLWLGDITYGIYLLHGFLLWITFQNILPALTGVGAGAFIPAAIILDAAIVILAGFVFVNIERPAISLGKRHYRILAAAAAAVHSSMACRARPGRL